jgi:hypothetical protein
MVCAIKILDSVLANRYDIEFEKKYVVYVYEMYEFFEKKSAERAPAMLVQPLASTFGIWNNREDSIEEFETPLCALYGWLLRVSSALPGVANIIEEIESC